MSRVRLLAATALVFVAFANAGVASASTVDQCTADLQQLRDDVATASFANAKDVTSLQGKLAQAEQKLAAGKTDDAIAKVVDFRTRVEQLGAAGKLGADDAATLAQGANQAIACIQAIEPA
jgi:hypothetical protein